MVCSNSSDNELGSVDVAESMKRTLFVSAVVAKSLALQLFIQIKSFDICRCRCFSSHFNCVCLFAVCSLIVTGNDDDDDDNDNFLQLSVH